jgi:cytochrome c oxidase assembly factor CtaG
MHTSILGALVTVAARLWYPLYAVRGEPWQINLLEDQQLAGLIMWVPAGVLLGLIALALFAAWLGEAGRRVSHANRLRLAAEGMRHHPASTISSHCRALTDNGGVSKSGQ